MTPTHVAVKEAVFPFAKFAGVDTLLGPEMRSTGEVMGIDTQLRGRVRQEPDRRRHQAARQQGRVFLSVQDSDKAGAVAVAKGLVELGFEVLATTGTHEFLRGRGRGQAGEQGARGAPPLRRPDPGR